MYGKFPDVYKVNGAIVSGGVWKYYTSFYYKENSLSALHVWSFLYQETKNLEFHTTSNLKRM